MTTSVYCKTEFAAVHSWPEADGAQEYLKYPHRHIFKVIMHVRVDHANRQFEFIELKNMLTDFCTSTWASQSTNSCEMMARTIIEWASSINLPVHSVDVSEDGENGALVTA